jgi:hypothetical protein
MCIFLLSLFINIRQFINDHVLINYFKKQVIQLYYNKYTNTVVLQTIYKKKALKKLHYQTSLVFLTGSFKKVSFL